MSKKQVKPVEKKARFYFGGVAGTCAAFFTHPLDLIKVNLQTHKDKTTIGAVVKNVIEKNGVIGLYNGISAACLRQMSYTLARFGTYEKAKLYFSDKTILGNFALSFCGGIGAAICGTPADVVNIRMQNDVKLPPDKQRNYKHAIDGLARMCKEEGFFSLYSGFGMGILRGSVLTFGQLVCYDQTKRLLLATPGFTDNLLTHFISSLASATTATLATQPIDVLKTRIQSQSSGELKGVVVLFKETLAEGPLAFFKGFVPALARLGPHTILTMIFLEQFRQKFGYIPVEEPVKKK